MTKLTDLFRPVTREQAERDAEWLKKQKPVDTSQSQEAMKQVRVTQKMTDLFRKANLP